VRTPYERARSDGFISDTGVVTQPAAPPLDLTAMLGGRRGVIDTSLPGVVLVVVDVFAPLGWAIAVSVVFACALAVVRKVRGEPLRQAAMGVGGLAVAAALAAWTGSARTYFLPGILANVGYGVATAVSIAVRRPLLGYAAALLDRGYGHWREDPTLLRRASYATAMWCAVFVVRACVQGYLYVHGDDSWLAPARLGLGLPLSAVALAGTLLVLEGQRREPVVAEAQLDSGSGWPPAS
jgi:hypothetical protein